MINGCKQFHSANNVRCDRITNTDKQVVVYTLCRVTLNTCQQMGADQRQLKIGFQILPWITGFYGQECHAIEPNSLPRLDFSPEWTYLYNQKKETGEDPLWIYEPRVRHPEGSSVGFMMSRYFNEKEKTTTTNACPTLMRFHASRYVASRCVRSSGGGRYFWMVVQTFFKGPQTARAPTHWFNWGSEVAKTSQFLNGAAAGFQSGAAQFLMQRRRFLHISSEINFTPSVKI